MRGHHIKLDERQFKVRDRRGVAVERKTKVD
jgi:hypothetical protein